MDKELTELELENVTAGYSNFIVGQDEDNLSLDDLENVFAGIPKEVLSEKLADEKVRLLNLREHVVQQINSQEQATSITIK